jgi:hypothetical protein
VSVFSFDHDFSYLFIWCEAQRLYMKDNFYRFIWWVWQLFTCKRWLPECFDKLIVHWSSEVILWKYVICGQHILNMWQCDLSVDLALHRKIAYTFMYKYEIVYREEVVNNEFTMLNIVYLKHHLLMHQMMMQLLMRFCRCYDFISSLLIDINLLYMSLQL